MQFKNRTRINILYREFGVLKLKDLHHFTIRCIVHKFIHSPHLLPVAINEIFCPNEQIHDYNTRNKKDQNKKKIIWRKEEIQRRNCWNNFPSNIKEINSIITHLAGQTYVLHGCKWNFIWPQIYLQPTKIKSQHFGVSLKFLLCN